MSGTTSNAPVRLLIADDDPTYRAWLHQHLDVLYPDADIMTVELIDLVERDEALIDTGADILLMAACFGTSPEDPRAAGLAFLSKLHRRAETVPGLPAIIALAQEGNELTAVHALRLGAADYIPKRLLTPERLATAIQNVLRLVQPCEIETRLTDDTLIHPAIAGAGPAMSQGDHQPPTGDDGRWQTPLPEGTLAPAAIYAALESPRGAPVPTLLIPGFLIRSCIGQSESSTVYLASSERWGEPVALKVSTAVRDEVAGCVFMEREYAAIRKIRSRCVATIHDYGVHGSLEYLVMEYLPRGDLKTRMRQGLSEDEALHYTLAVARALQVIHDAGVLHRDLKPPNVLLREDNDVALIDFGVARAVEGDAAEGPAATVRGSPYYMSPEHALGEPLDARADFYSLGVMLYEMLTGTRPYMGGTARDVLQQHVSAPAPQLPLELARHQPILTRLLAKARQDRFATAAEIVAALEELRAALLAETEPDAAWG
jgi:DNA-binding NarL/FixJ family response regulator